MQLTFVTDLGQSFVVDIDADMELENVMALLEAESEIPIGEQSISLNGQELSNPKATMAECGVGDQGMLLLRRKVVVAGRTAEQDSEMMRLQVLGNPDLMRQLDQTQPEMAQAARSDPVRFSQLLRLTRERQHQAEQAQQREIMQLNADPYDVEAQRKIEEAIRQQAVMENMEHAIEYSPESFGRVTMLYIPVEVNSRPVKAFVDSGAQQTIMSPDCAEACGLMRLLDTRFAGIARGVGTAKIFGRVHSAQLKLADLFLPCSFTIMEGRDVDLLLGLDMLKAHQACIDLAKNVLRIQGREVGFLSEHELPDKAKAMEEPEAGPSSESETAPKSIPTSTPAPRQSPFPGGGNTLGATPATTGAAVVGRQPIPQPIPAGHSEQKIATLVALGATKELAIQCLNAAEGNVDLAAGFLFQ